MRRCSMPKFRCPAFLFYGVAEIRGVPENSLIGAKRQNITPPEDGFKSDSRGFEKRATALAQVSPPKVKSRVKSAN